MDGALTGLAENPAAPEDVLFRLAAEPSVARRLAWRRELPDPVVEWLLAHGDPDIAFALDSWFQTETTRQRIATHPDPRIREARRASIEHDVRNGDWVTPADLDFYGGLVTLARHQDPVLRAAVARSWVEMPEELRRELLLDRDPAVRALAAGAAHPPVPADLLPRLLADEATRQRVAAYAPLTPAAVRDCLAGDEDLRAELAVNPELPLGARDQLAVDPSPWVRAKVLLRRDLAVDHREQLYRALVASQRAEQDEVRFALDNLEHERPAWLAELPLDDRIGYLDSPIPCFRRTAASSPDLPPEVMRRLDEHPDVEVRRIVAHRPDCPGEVLATLVIDHGERREEPLLVRHPNFPAEALPRLAAAAQPHRRALAAVREDLPEECLVRLARDPVEFVRVAAAQHPRIPLAELENLLGDREVEVVAAAAANPVLPVQAMRALLDRAGL
ncbi:hypothetical protein N8J89_27955 [Crossiella sp. CA-258035]|uniref:hypothetical protein n=1 Tax=Crossiella sp. CA-258035 TaxID=2981138 RepID=UPI0024BCC545|nr:hypothetical protein [Crossiella sp. CA-258035]WHT16951.1 hypothetical protein N8J89_27955 [Crossiella sp. CA-258035]